MRVVVAGAGHLGTQVAYVLVRTEHELTVIDRSPERIADLTSHLAARLVLGDACEPSVLEEAGAHNADLMIAATGEDEDNLVISLLSHRQFGVARVVARVNDPDNTWLFDERWGVDIAVPAEAPLVSLIEEAAGSTDTVALLRLSKAGVNVIETSITAASRSAGRSIADLHLPAGFVIATVIRAGHPTVPSTSFVLAPGDEVLVVSDTATREQVRAAFQ